MKMNVPIGVSKKRII